MGIAASDEQGGLWNLPTDGGGKRHRTAAIREGAGDRGGNVWNAEIGELHGAAGCDLLKILADVHPGGPGGEDGGDRCCTPGFSGVPVRG